MQAVLFRAIGTLKESAFDCREGYVRPARVAGSRGERTDAGQGAGPWQGANAEAREACEETQERSYA